MIHQITRNETTRNNTNNISCQFVSLVRVVSWIGCLLKTSAQANKKLPVCYTEEALRKLYSFLPTRHVCAQSV
jgi:hypothetical protein